MSPFPESRARVLVVEDEAIIALGLQQDLAAAGYDVSETASNEAEAIACVERLRPDLVLMDINLRGERDGVDLAEELVRRFGSAVVFLTAYADARTLERAQRVGYGYLVKPYDERELHSTVQIALARARALRVVQANADWMGSTLNALSEMVVIVNEQGRVVVANDAALSRCGVTLQEALERPVEEILRLTLPEGAPAPALLAQRAFETGRVESMDEDVACLMPDGEKFYLNYQASPVVNRDSRIVGVAIVLRDVTEKHARQLEAAKMHNLEALGRLAGGIAHDFNNLLTVIVANTSMLRYQAQSMPQVLPMLERIEAATERAVAITAQFLTFAKGGAPLQREVPVGPLIEAALRIFDPSGVSGVAVRIPEDVWHLQADEQQVSQLVQNLLANARDATPAGQGGISITACNVPPNELPRTFSGDRGLAYVRITVRDQGDGIPEENLQRVFDPYFTTRAGRAGLGLSSVHSIVRRHHGHVALESVVGRGTTVHVYLPALPASVQATWRMEPPPIEGRKPRILVMDDEEMVRVSIRRMLEALGCACEIAPDGEDALSRYLAAREAEDPFDAVLLDLLVPHGMGGEEAIRQLLKLDPDVKAVVASGYSQHPVIACYKEHGFQGVLQKPFGLNELDEVLRSLGVCAPLSAHPRVHG